MFALKFSALVFLACSSKHCAGDSQAITSDKTKGHNQDSTSFVVILPTSIRPSTDILARMNGSQTVQIDSGPSAAGHRLKSHLTHPHAASVTLNTSTRAPSAYAGSRTATLTWPSANKASRREMAIASSQNEMLTKKHESVRESRNEEVSTASDFQPTRNSPRELRTMSTRTRSSYSLQYGHSTSETSILASNSSGLSTRRHEIVRESRNSEKVISASDFRPLTQIPPRDWSTTTQSSYSLQYNDFTSQTSTLDSKSIIRSTMIVQAGSVLQPEPSVRASTQASALSQTTIHHSHVHSSGHLGGSEVYHTNIEHSNSAILRTQTSRTRRPVQTITTSSSSLFVGGMISTKDILRSQSSVSYLSIAQNTSQTSRTIITSRHKNLTASPGDTDLRQSHSGQTMRTNTKSEATYYLSSIGYFSTNKLQPSGVTSSPTLTSCRKSQPTATEKVEQTKTTATSILHERTSEVNTAHTVLSETLESTKEFVLVQQSLVGHTSKSPSTTFPTYNNFPANERSPSMPIYLLAICLPLALLCGFALAFAYFKCSKQDHRTTYSVTVEIASEDPSYEMKRMYSIIDVNAANINKDFWSALESDNSPSSIMDLTSLKQGACSQTELRRSFEMRKV